VKRRTFLAAVALCVPGLAALPSTTAQAAVSGTYIAATTAGLTPDVTVTM